MIMLRLVYIPFYLYISIFIVKSYQQIEQYSISNIIKNHLSYGIRFKITIQSYSNIIKYNDTYFNNIFIALFNDKVYVVPNVTIELPNIYVIDTILYENGQYSIYIQTEWPNFPDSQECNKRRNLEKMHKINHIISDNRLLIDINYTNVIKNENENYCIGYQNFQGRFIVENMPKSSLLTENIYSTFKPNQCHIKHRYDYNREYSHKIRHELVKNIIFLGDSTLELIFKGIFNRLFGEYSFQTKNNDIQIRKELLKFHFEGGPKINRWYDYQDQWGGPRLTFLFNGGPQPSDNYIGAALSNFPWGNINNREYSLYYLELLRIIRESISNCKSIIILFNTGVHDIASKAFTFEKYKFGINQSLINLKELVNNELHNSSNTKTCTTNNNTLSIKLFWLTTVPFLEGNGEGNGFQCLYLGNSGIKKINEIATSLAIKHGYEVLDHYALRIPFPYDGDGLHCQRLYYQEGDAIKIKSCNIIIDAVINTLVTN